MRRLVLAATLAAVAAAAGYGVYWFAIARELREGLPQWAEARRAEGYAVAWRKAEIGGFPLAFRLRLEGVSLVRAQRFAVTARAAEMVATSAPWNLRHWRFSAPRGAVVTAPLEAAAVTAATLTGSVAAEGDATRVTATASGLAGHGGADGFAARALTAELTLPAHPPETYRDTMLTLSASLDAADLPEAPPPLARRIDTLSLTARIKGEIASGPLDLALARWRDAGGTIEIEHGHVAWGSATVELDGTLALDAALQPEGALTATVTGADTIVDAVVAAGAMEQRFAAFAKSVLHAIALPGADGTERLHVPVTVQDQRLYLGPAAIAALPHVSWR
jgi:hypothetical protein